MARRSGLTRKDIEEIQGRFAEHTLTERQSISWHMAKHEEQPDGRKVASSFYAYSVTWTPGTLVVAGDIGDLTVNHWHAMRTIEGTMDWLDGIDFDYFMGKSTQREQFDPDATVEDIARAANEPAIEMLNGYNPGRHGFGRRSYGHRHDLQRYRRERLAALLDWDQDETEWAVLGRVQNWRAIYPDQRPVLADYLPEKPEQPRITRVANPKYDRRKPLADYDIPDGWKRWAAIWHECLDYEDPNIVFTAEGRRRLKEEMRGKVDNERDAVDFAYSIGLDDYYGTYNWTHAQRALFEAVRAWHAKVSPPYLEKIKAERAARKAQAV